jgi:heme a synthase
MLLDIHREEAVAAPAPPYGDERPGRFAALFACHRIGPLRAALAAASLFGFLAFVLGAGNRLTSGPWFLYPPEVSLLPPFGRAAWQHAFVLHQESPLYALCGGYDVGGMESVTIYKFLYWWEWSRIAAIVLFCSALFVAALLYLGRAAAAPHRVDPKPWLALLAAAVAYFVLGYYADHAGLFATINLGQHRHALDVTTASLGLAVLMAAALAPGRSGRMLSRAAWGVPMALTIFFGALFQSLDAGPLWTTFPGYTGGLLPGPDRLFAFHPLWRNLTENGYLIQACHRLLAIGLWAAAVVAVANALRRRERPWWALTLAGLLTLEGGLGIATLRLGEPATLSVIHQALAVVVLAAALTPRGRFAPKAL